MCSRDLSTGGGRPLRHARLLTYYLMVLMSLLGVSVCSIVQAQGTSTATAVPPVLMGHVVAVGIPGASALSPVGIFHPGGPLHDKPDFAAFTRPGAVLDPARLLVASSSNFGAPFAQPDKPAGAILSLDPRTEMTLVIPPMFAVAGGQATALEGKVQVLTAQSPAFVDPASNPQAVTGDLAPVSDPRGISLNNAFGRPWFANTPGGMQSAGVESVIDPDGRPFAGAPHKIAGGVFTGTVANRETQHIPGALTSGAVGTALLGKSPDGSGRAVFAVVQADGSLVQVHVEKGVDGLAPAGTIQPLPAAHLTVTRAGIAFNWVPNRLLFVTDPWRNAVAVLGLVDDGALFHLTSVTRFAAPAFNLPIDIAPAVPEVANPGFSSNTTLAGGSDLYVANRGNGTIVRLRQVEVPGAGPLGAGRLNGIAVSPDAAYLWVTVSGVVPEFPQQEGVIVQLPAFGAPVVGSGKQVGR